MIYLILAPLLVFFFLKDKEVILGWFMHFFPKDTQLSTQVWREMDQQIGNYVRGKFWEITIVSVICFITFSFLGLKYALLVSILVGLSVVIPYIGATVVTFPVALMGFFQWGWTPDFAWFMFAYGIIQALDGNVIVPLLFSEVVNIHPVAIIVAILFFGCFVDQKKEGVVRVSANESDWSEVWIVLQGCPEPWMAEFKRPWMA